MTLRRPRVSVPITIGWLVLGAACSSANQSSASGAPSTEPDAASMTTYDASAPLDLAEDAPPQVDADGVSVQDVSWASPGGGRVSAWLVVPPGSGPFAGLVYLHGSETNRDDFRDEAVAMAHGGAVSLVVDAPFARTGESRHNYLLNFGLPERERDMTVQAIVDLRRAYDLLASRPDVDPTRLGFVGHSWGASAGAVLAAVDQRPAALVLLSGRPTWTGFLRESTDGWVDSYRELVGPEKWETYLRVMAPFDALAVAGELDGGRIYLQYGRTDDVVPTSVSQALLDALPDAKADLYDAGHALDDAATADRAAWLVERLGLLPVGADVLAEVGLPDE
jgi:dienelactone hydrolase